MARKSGKDWEETAVKRPGALHRALGVPQGQPIPANKVKKAAKQGGRVGEEARLAEQFKRQKRSGSRGRS